MTEARNPERRPHNKSRRGCLKCKMRHVKCNEIRPECGHCLRLGIRCTWPASPMAHDEPIAPSPISAPLATTPRNNFHSPPSSSADTGITPDLAIADMKLLHFWMQNTSATCAFAGNNFLWQSTFPEMGFRHPFLLRGILAVAAVHKAHVYPDESEDLRLQSSVHMNAAIAAFREHIRFPDPTTSVPVFALSCLIAMHHMGTAQLQPPVDAIATSVVWMRLTKGVRAACEPHWDRILASEMATVVAHVRRSEERKDSEVDIICLRNLVREHVLDNALRDTYVDAIDELHIIASNVRYPLAKDQSPISIITSWPATISYRMTDLIEGKDAIALVIVGHFAALLSTLEDRSWYLRNWGTWIIREAVERVAGTEFEPWLDWPRKMVSKDGLEK